MITPNVMDEKPKLFRPKHLKRSAEVLMKTLLTPYFDTLRPKSPYTFSKLYKVLVESMHQRFMVASMVKL